MTPRNVALKEVRNILNDFLEKRQDRPDQYVVVYKRKSDDSIIGYHLNTFNQITDDILKAKRYAGENPYPQLQVIADNLQRALSGELEQDILGALYKTVRIEHFKNMPASYIYVDAVYLAEGTPKQSFKIEIFEP